MAAARSHASLRHITPTHPELPGLMLYAQATPIVRSHITPLVCRLEEWKWIAGVDVSQSWSRLHVQSYVQTCCCRHSLHCVV